MLTPFPRRGSFLFFFVLRVELGEFLVPACLCVGSATRVGGSSLGQAGRWLLFQNVVVVAWRRGAVVSVLGHLCFPTAWECLPCFVPRQAEASQSATQRFLRACYSARVSVSPCWLRVQ